MNSTSDILFKDRMASAGSVLFIYQDPSKTG